MVGRKWSLSPGGYRYGFNGKENDNEIKGEGNQQDYGLRIYDPRMGKFLSVDPLSPKYPGLTPYQFASNTPIEAIDLDGGEARHINIKGRVWTESMPSDALRHSVPSDDYMPSVPAAAGGPGVTNRGAMAAGGVVLAVATGSGIVALSEAAFWRVGFWLAVPSNQLVISTAAGFTFNLLNPDPGTHVEFPGYGNELGETVNWALKNSGGKTVNFFVQQGSKFANKSEWKWAQRLLNEGNNVMLWKDVEQTAEVSVRNSDLLVNGLGTEIKELSNMTVGPNMVRNLVNKFKDAAGQASSVIIDGVNQKGFTREVAQEVLQDLSRKVKRNTTFRVVGEGFDFTETVKAKKD